jgi:hypothetical protein
LEVAAFKLRSVCESCAVVFVFNTSKRCMSPLEEEEKESMEDDMLGMGYDDVPAFAFAMTDFIR